MLADSAGLTLRPLTSVLPASGPGVWMSRRVLATVLNTLSRPLRGTRLEPVYEPTPNGPIVRGEWVRAPGVHRVDAVLLYLHGSAYALCSARTHRGLTSRMSQVTGLPVFACDYRLAPRHRFPAAARDVRAAYDWLRRQGHPADRIVLAGDSAGGHLAVDLVCELNRAGLPVPAGMALFSPLIDLTFGLARERERSRRDPLISADRAARLVALYTRGAPAGHPRLAPRPAEGMAWPPTLVHAGGAEMLAADAEHLDRMVRAAGGDSTLRVWPGQVHVFQAFAALVPEGRKALDEAGRFLLDALDRHTEARLEEVS
jgi:acetyl esterase/lipase